MAEDKRRAEAREIDEMALKGPKSKWQEASAPAAGDPVSDLEKRGHDIIAQADPRGDGSIAGVGDARPNDANKNAANATPADDA